MYLPPTGKANLLTSEDRSRYSRNILLPGFGPEGQERLKGARVAVVGAGGLGSPVILYLAAAGVGTIGIIDDDSVELSNLQRQILHATPDVGSPKVDSAAVAARRINPTIEIHTHPTRLQAGNALEILEAYDLVVDGADNFATRYLVADAAQILDIAHVWGSIHQFEGHLSVFWTSKGPAYRDLFPIAPPAELAPNCSDAGVIGALCGIIGAAMASEAIKLIAGIGNPLVGRLSTYDALEHRWSTLSIPANPNRTAVKFLTDYEDSCNVGPSETIEPVALNHQLCSKNPPMLIDVRGPKEYASGHILGAIPIPLGTLRNSDLLSDVSDRRSLVFVCKAGVRSAQALKVARERGHSNVFSLVGGLDAWVREDLPIIALSEEQH